MYWLAAAIIPVKTLFPHLKACFLTVKLLKKMELGPSKLKYLVNHRLAPYFKEFLSDDILKSMHFVVSLMKAWTTVQKYEMDLLVRYWDSTKNRVQVWCWNSMFFGHGTNPDLLKNFDEGISGLNMSKLI